MGRPRHISARLKSWTSIRDNVHTVPEVEETLIPSNSGLEFRRYLDEPGF